jgi:hypothetical protein
MPAKSQWMMGPRCSGELRECWLGKAVRDSGGSGVDERRRGKTGTGGRLAFVLKSVSMAQAERERGGVGVGASTWRWEKEESGVLPWWSVARGVQRRPPTIGRGWRHCRMNKGGWRAWATWGKVADKWDRAGGASWQQPGCWREREREAER